MSKYGSNYEYWYGEHKEMLDWVLDNEGKITIGAVIDALARHPGCNLDITEPEFNLCREVIPRHTYGLRSE